MPILLLQMFLPNVRKSKYLYTLPEMLYFYDLEKPGTFGTLNQSLCDTGTELFKPHRTRVNGISSLKELRKS
jgi:hypothetical protein